MNAASPTYLAELAEEFLASQVAIGWKALANSELKGETTWIDPTPAEPGVEVAMNYRAVLGGVEIKVVAYQPDERGQPMTAIKRVATIISGIKP